MGWVGLGAGFAIFGLIGWIAVEAAANFDPFEDIPGDQFPEYEDDGFVTVHGL